MMIPDFRITRNAAKCMDCNDEIESAHRHDFVTCSCGNFSVDGGRAYIKRSGILDNYKELSEFEQYFRKPFVGIDDEKIEWLKDNDYPEDDNWSQPQKVLYKLTWD